MEDPDELLTIGQLARRTGLPVRTIRFWSDLEVAPPACRSAGGYRLYDTDAVARLDLVRTLRELGLDLETVQRVLGRQAGVADVARAHLAVVEAEIRALQVRRSVLRWVVQRGGTAEELRLMNELARLSAQERRRMLDDFVDDVFAGVDPEAPGARIAQAMRTLPAELPEQPTPEQVDAWVELAELVRDPSFRDRTRQMATGGEQTGGGQTGSDQAGDGFGLQASDAARVGEHAGAALAAGIAPGSERAVPVLERILGSAAARSDRAALADRLELYTDRRVERYWQLLGILNGWPPMPSQAPAFEWLIATLRAHA